MDHMSKAQSQYLDATANVFMEQYAALLETGILQEAQACQETLPAELDARCQALLRSYQKKERHLTWKKRALRALPKVAMATLVLFSVFSALFFSVEAFRLPIMNFFIEKHNAYWLFSGQPIEDPVPTTFNEKDPLADILPGDFYLEALNGDYSDLIYDVAYTDGSGRYVTLSIITADSRQVLNTENAEIQHFSLAGQDAVLVSNDMGVTLTWLNTTYSRIFTLTTVGIDQNYVVFLGEQITDMFP